MFYDMDSRSFSASSMVTPSKRVRKEMVTYSDTTVILKPSSKKKRRKSPSKAKSPANATNPLKVLVSGSKRRNISKAKPRSSDALKTEIALVLSRLEKLRASREKLELAIQASIKFPVPDELIAKIDFKGKKSLPLPVAFTKLGLPDDIVSDALMVWDCLHMFSSQLNLFPIGVDDFMRYDRLCFILSMRLKASLFRIILHNTVSWHIQLRPRSHSPRFAAHC